MIKKVVDKLTFLVILGATFCSVLAYWGSSHWWLELLTHFRAFYFYSAIVVLVLLLVTRRLFLALLALFILGLNWQVPMLYLPPSTLVSSALESSPKSTDTKKKSIVIYHANVLSSNTQYQKLVQQLSDYQPDIIVLQEVTEGWLKGIEDGITDYPYQITKPEEGNFGIALFSRFPFNNKQTVQLSNTGIPSIFVSAQTPQGELSVFTTHPLPPVSVSYSLLRDFQLEATAKFFQSVAAPYLLVGDLNTTPWSPVFKRLMKQAKLKNARQGIGILPTWPAPLPLLQIPIDHVLHSENIEIISMEVAGHIGSDHLPIVTKLHLVDKGSELETPHKAAE
ncbi:endonuclease/exonuclease/phosphatase family protein [Zooshikella ganghwensis]|uniref:Endonuclease/exonuclease/phosphatase family protein n=1 Tax=Zooshikella ganghwensis TaxID=202772 RepID=A0A4P9VHP7_9GAMM|nr:endonuclease/exonuclease/phosphatase family protein [Zooshikella ganghwensis]RDH42026.1 endonuclease/exonuclease/phosphatase family protein [Zooshikella ganghwensis]